MTPPLGLILGLMQDGAAERAAQTRSALSLWLVLAVGSLVGVAVLGTIVAANRRRREARAKEQARDRKPVVDAWNESARRLEVQPPESPEDDDLRIQE